MSEIEKVFHRGMDKDHQNPKVLAGGVVNKEADMLALQELGVESLMSEQLTR